MYLTLRVSENLTAGSMRDKIIRVAYATYTKLLRLLISIPQDLGSQVFCYPLADSSKKYAVAPVRSSKHNQLVLRDGGRSTKRITCISAWIELDMLPALKSLIFFVKSPSNGRDLNSA